MRRIFGFLFFVLFIVEALLGYYFVNFHIPKEYLSHLLSFLSFNDKILFVVSFLLPYVVFFLIWMIPFFFAKNNQRDFLVTSFSFFFTATCVFVFYLLFHTSLLSPHIPPKSWLDKGILFLYSLNRPANLFPVQYVIFTILSNLVLFRLNIKIAYLLLPITLLVIYFFFTIGQITLLSFITSLIIALFGFLIFVLGIM